MVDSAGEVTNGTASTDSAPIPKGDPRDTQSRSSQTAPVVACSAVRREYTRGRSDAVRALLGRGRERPAVTALDDVSLAVHRGEFVGLAGPSGSGKSTLIHLLSGLDTPTSGRVTLLGRETGTLSPAERARLRLDHVGIVFQQFHLLPTLTARANVALPLVEQGVAKSRRRERAAALLEEMGLGARLDHLPGELSGGEQQRVAIARALVTDPDLLLADEPTGELDSKTGRQVLDQLEQAASDRAVVVASHDHHVLERTDRLVRLQDGCIVDG